MNINSNVEGLHISDMTDVILIPEKNYIYNSLLK